MIHPIRHKAPPADNNEQDEFSLSLKYFVYKIGKHYQAVHQLNLPINILGTSFLRPISVGFADAHDVGYSRKCSVL